MRNNRLENEILKRVDELIQRALSVSLKDEPGRQEQLASAVALVQEMGDILLEVLEGQEQHLQALLEQLINQRLPDRRILHSFGNFAQDINYIVTEGIASYLKTSGKNISGDLGEQIVASEAFHDTLYEDSEDLEQATPEVIVPAAGTGTAISPSLEQEQFASAEGLQEKSEEPEQSNGAIATNLNNAPEPLNPSMAEKPLAIPEVDTPEDIRTTDSTIIASETVNSNLESLRLALLQAYPGEELIADYPTPHGNIAFFMPRLQLGFELADTHHDWRYDFYCRRKGISLRLINTEELLNPSFLARRLRREALWQQRP